MATLELGPATYEDALGRWHTSISLASDRYRVPIRGIVFAGPLDALQPELHAEVKPRVPGNEMDAREPGWRPTPVLLQRVGDSYEAQTPDGAHRGRVIAQATDHIGASPPGGWPPVPVNAGFAYDGSALLELCTGRLEFTIEVSVGDAHQSGHLRVEVDIAMNEARLTLTMAATVATTAWSGHLERALGQVAPDLGPGRFIRRCFFCQFSDYSYAGQGLSGMACFRDARQRYLAIRSKRDYMQMYPHAVTEWVDELYVCPEFTPRVPGTGYRG